MMKQNIARACEIYVVSTFTLAGWLWFRFFVSWYAVSFLDYCFRSNWSKTIPVSRDKRVVGFRAKGYAQVSDSPSLTGKLLQASRCDIQFFTK